MPDLFSPYTLKGVTLRNRIVMSPMTMYNSVDGKLDDYHVSYLGARAAGGFALVFGEQMCITPMAGRPRRARASGATSRSKAMRGSWRSSGAWGQLRRSKLGTPGARAASCLHRGVNADRTKKQLPPDHPDSWTCVAPSAIPYGGGGHTYPVHALTVDEIRSLHRSYADAAVRARDAGYQWLELHFAHGYLGASFFSPLANQPPPTSTAAAWSTARASCSRRWTRCVRSGPNSIR